MICKFCGGNYEPMLEYCDCDQKLKTLYAHAAVKIMPPTDNFLALVKDMFEGKTLFDTVALHRFIENRERKAFEAAQKHDYRNDPYYPSFDSYKTSKEYLE